MDSKNQGNHESIESEPSEKMEVDNDEEEVDDLRSFAESITETPRMRSLHLGHLKMYSRCI